MAFATEDPLNLNPYAVAAPDLSGNTGGPVPDEPIVLEGDMGLEQSLRLARMFRVPRGLVGTGIIVGLVPLLMAGASVYWTGDMDWPRYFATCTVLILIMGSMFLAIIALPFLGGWLDRWCFRRGILKPVRFRCIVSDAGVQTAERGKTTWHVWDRHRGFSETDDMILLWRRGNIAVALPKEFAASESEWERLREALYARLPLVRV